MFLTYSVIMQLQVDITHRNSTSDIRYSLFAFNDNKTWSRVIPSDGRLRVPDVYSSFWLYRICKNPMMIQQLVGTSQWASRDTIQIVDVDGHIQATIKVRGTMPSKLDNDDSKDKFAHWIRQSQLVYTKTLRYNDSQFYVYVDTPVGRMPMLSFPLLATRIKSSDPEPLLWRLYQLARMHGIDKDDEGELLAEMCTMMLRAMLYLPDTVRGDDGKEHVTDQWSRLLCFPELELAGYDCEDGSELVLEILHVLKTAAKLTHPELQRLQKLLRDVYVPFLALGQLKTEGIECVPHAFVVLLDRAYAGFLLKGDEVYEHDLHSSIVIESTNYTESVWNNTQRHRARYSNPVDKLLDQQSNLETVLKTKTPMEVTKRDNMYQSLTALMTAEFVEGEVGHWVMTSSQNNKVGVALKDLMDYSTKKIKARPLLVLDKDRTKELHNALNKLPPSTWPTASKAELEYPKLGRRIVADMRQVDYEQVKSELPSKFDVIHNAITSDGLELTSLTC